jgi:hypothetical protein
MIVVEVASSMVSQIAVQISGDSASRRYFPSPIS